MERTKTAERKKYWWRGEDTTGQACSIPYYPGQRCPNCHKGDLAYDGLFQMTLGWGHVEIPEEFRAQAESLMEQYRQHQVEQSEG